MVVAAAMVLVLAVLVVVLAVLVLVLAAAAVVVLNLVVKTVDGGRWVVMAPWCE